MAVQVDRHRDQRRGTAASSSAAEGVPPAAAAVGVDDEGVVAGAWDVSALNNIGRPLSDDRNRISRVGWYVRCSIKRC